VTVATTVARARSVPGAAGSIRRGAAPPLRSNPKKLHNNCKHLGRERQSIHQSINQSINQSIAAVRDREQSIIIIKPRNSQSGKQGYRYHFCSEETFAAALECRGIGGSRRRRRRRREGGGGGGGGRWSGVEEFRRRVLASFGALFM